MKLIKNFLLLSAVSIVIFSFPSCSKSSLVGSDLLPVGDGFDIRYVDSFSVKLNTVKEDTLLTSAKTINLCGKVNDPIFGQTVAGIYTQLRIGSVIPNFKDAVLDSVVLSLTYLKDSVFVAGSLSSTQTWKVEELSEAVVYGNNYYSNKNFAIKGALVNNYAFKVSYDSIKIDTHYSKTKLAPHLRIPLSNTFGQALITPSDTTVFYTTAKFQDYFKGLYISPELLGQNNLITRFNMRHSQTKMTVYFRQNGALKSYDFLIDAQTNNVNYFEHDRTNSVVFDASHQDSLAYIQGMAGVLTKIELPTIMNIGKVAINKAELVVTVADTTNRINFPLIPQLIVSYKNSSNQKVVIEDVGYAISVINSFTSFGGSPSTDGQFTQYSMNVTKHLQDMVNGKITEKNLYLSTYLPSERPNRGVFVGHKNSLFANTLAKPYLKIAYTVVPQ